LLFIRKSNINIARRGSTEAISATAATATSLMKASANVHSIPSFIKLTQNIKVTVRKMTYNTRTLHCFKKSNITKNTEYTKQ